MIRRPLVFLLAAAFTLTALPRSAGAADFSTLSNTGRPGQASPSQSSQDYWTPERLKNAQPLPLPEARGNLQAGSCPKMSGKRWE